MKQDPCEIKKARAPSRNTALEEYLLKIKVEEGLDEALRALAVEYWAAESEFNGGQISQEEYLRYKEQLGYAADALGLPKKPAPSETTSPTLQDSPREESAPR